jgi:hypothetical protein
VELSGGYLVLVCESAKDLFPADPVRGEVDFGWPDAGLSRVPMTLSQIAFLWVPVVGWRES